MTTTTMLPAPPDTSAPGVIVDGERSFVIEGLRYEQYAAIADALPDRANPRLVFFDGRLTFVSPSPTHEEGSEYLCDLVKAIAIGCGIALKPARSTTYRHPDLAAGAEGDGAFYLAQHARDMHGAKAVDLTTQPPPDLVIEVQYKHSADDAVSAWGRLRVPEVWRYDVRRGTLLILHRRDDGSYTPVDRSFGLPALFAADILEQLKQADALEYGQWLAQLNLWVREVIIPRLGGGV